MTPTYGPNLEALIEGNCISRARAGELTEQQKSDIEALDQEEIDTLIEVQEKVGQVINGLMI